MGIYKQYCFGRFPFLYAGIGGEIFIHSDEFEYDISLEQMRILLHMLNGLISLLKKIIINTLIELLPTDKMEHLIRISLYEILDG
jgi:hypothetical protein